MRIVCMFVGLNTSWPLQVVSIQAEGIGRGQLTELLGSCSVQAI